VIIRGWIDTGASFETAASRPPQDEENFLMPLKINLMLRSAQRAHLEARRDVAAALQVVR